MIIFGILTVMQYPINTVQTRLSPSNGFTLLELLVVIAIIGLLASLVAPRLFGQISKSERETARAQIDSISKALDTYRVDMGQYPTTEQGLSVLSTRPSENAIRWRGPYLQKQLPPDPWGRMYEYKGAGEGRDYSLLSLGKDGRIGGEGDNEDVVSWK